MTRQDRITRDTEMLENLIRTKSIIINALPCLAQSYEENLKQMKKFAVFKILVFVLSLLEPWRDWETAEKIRCNPDKDRYIRLS